MGLSIIQKQSKVKWPIAVTRLRPSLNQASRGAIARRGHFTCKQLLIELANVRFVPIVNPYEPRTTAPLHQFSEQR